MNEFSELVLARMDLLMDQSCSVLPLRSAKAREFGELWREKSTRAPWAFSFKLARTSSFRPARTDKLNATLDSKNIYLFLILYNCDLFPFVRSVWSAQSVLKRNARAPRYDSGQNGPPHGSELLSSPAPVGESAGIWRVVAGKIYARALDLFI